MEPECKKRYTTAANKSTGCGFDSANELIALVFNFVDSNKAAVG